MSLKDGNVRLWESEEYLSFFTELYSFRHGGKIRLSKTIDYNLSDFEINYIIAHEKSSAGSIVDILPILHINDSYSRDIVFPDAKRFKNPDLRIDGKLFEIENPSGLGKHTIKHSISEASKQADYVIINLPAWKHINELRGPAKGKFIDYPALKLVEYRINGTYIPFYRNTFKYDQKEPIL